MLFKMFVITAVVQAVLGCVLLFASGWTLDFDESTHQHTLWHATTFIGGMILCLIGTVTLVIAELIKRREDD